MLLNICLTTSIAAVLQGKVGEKLEKRREQNRRAAATYRDKQRRKKLTVEQVEKVRHLSLLFRFPLRALCSLC